MAAAFDTVRDVVFAAEVVGRPSATFLQLTVWPAVALPTPGAYAGGISTARGRVPCAIRVLDDTATVWCQLRAPLPSPALGEGVSVTIFTDPWSHR